MHLAFADESLAVKGFHLAKEIVSVHARAFGDKQQLLADSGRIMMAHDHTRPDTVFAIVKMRLKDQPANILGMVREPVGRIEGVQGPSFEIDGHAGLHDESEFGA